MTSRIVQILLEHRELPTSSYHLTRRCRCGEVIGKSRDRDEVRKLHAEHQAGLILTAMSEPTGEPR